MTQFLRRHCLLVISLLVLLNSCTVSRRHYRKGYYVDWQTNRHMQVKKQHRVANPVPFPAELPAPAIVKVPQIPVAELNQDARIFNSLLSGVSTYTGGCDIMIFRAGEELEVKVTEVLQNSIKYKYCERLDGPTYETQKRDVFMVKYANGTREVFDAAQTNSSNNSSNNSGTNNGPIINSAPGQPSGNNTGNDHSGDRSFWVTLVLLLLVGFLGVHRFYLGDIYMGVVYLLTLGLCGVGVLVDLILLIVGSLEPEDGEFYDQP